MKHEPTGPTQRWCRRCGHPSSDRLLDAAKMALAAIELLGAAARNQTDVTDAQLAACVNAAGDWLRAAIARAEATGHA